MLPVPYFHVVFTVPEELNIAARRAPRLFYNLLFRAAADALIDVAATKLRARIGVLSVLHTWTQTLTLHPHIHCVVPGGGFSLDQSRWLRVRKRTFFLPVRVLSRRFRTRLCDAIEGATFPPTIDDASFRVLLAKARSRDWVVYCKPPFGGPPQVLQYLANYTHRIAISNRRILSFDGEHVGFRYRHSANGAVAHSVMQLAAGEFLRRFLLHVLPSRFVRIRYYGFMSNRHRAHSLRRARAFVGDRTEPASPKIAVTPIPCPHCKGGTLRSVCFVPPTPAPDPHYADSS